ncbi:hypothetical protein FRX31_032118, partial [Thalictrum thalictroides]
LTQTKSASPISLDVIHSPDLSNPRQSNKLWSTLFKKLPPSAGESSLEFSSPIFKDGFLQIPEKVKEEGAKLWEQHVVGFFLDKKLPFNYVKSAVTNRWKTLREFEIALDGDLYYFKFSTPEDREHVLDEGSFHLAGKLFVIRPWTREVESSRGMIKFVPVWVKMSRVPKDLWNPKGFSLLCSAIATIPLSPEVSIDLEYPWQPQICCICQVFCHPTSKRSPPPQPIKDSDWNHVKLKKNSPGILPLQPLLILGDLSSSKQPAVIQTGLPPPSSQTFIPNPSESSTIVVDNVEAISETSEAYSLEDGTLHKITNKNVVESKEQPSFSSSDSLEAQSRKAKKQDLNPGTIPEPHKGKGKGRKKQSKPT